MGVRHMCTRVYFIYIYSYYYYNARHQHQLSICFASLFAILCRDICNIFRFALVVSYPHTTLHYITPLQRLRPICITLPADG